MGDTIWHDFKEHPDKDGFYLSLLKIAETNQSYYDITPFKDGRWKYRTAKLIPADIDDLDHDYTGCTVQFIKWTELPDL